MNLSKFSFAIVFLILCQTSFAQQATVGVLTLEEEAYEGYTFFSPFSGTKAYLIDNCGNLINEWDRGTRPGLAAYFLEDGTMLRTFKVNPEGPFTSASNAGGIEKVDWNNNVIWQYRINTETQLSHHDAIEMPNGNILILTWELTYEDELIELGRDPDRISNQGFMWSEKILELKPIGTNDAEIVWQWHINDHYIQEFDSTKSNFGVVRDHPELFNINLPELDSPNSNSSRDWNHFNSIDYNEELDQILLSVRNSDEIWILDHSTTIEEAASHEGGNSGKGGDILYRWGNASAYNAAPLAQQKLFGQHGVHWIEDVSDGERKILIFNNGNGIPNLNDFSRVQLLTPPFEDGQYPLQDGIYFGPEVAPSVYGHLDSEAFYSAYMSNAQQLPNGNFLINAGSPGRIFETTPGRQIVWEYEIPLFGDTPATQGQNVSSNSNFRAYKYGVDYPGFENVDLTPGMPIENNPLPCPIVVSTDDIESVLHPITKNGRELSIQMLESGKHTLNIYDSLGRSLYTREVFGDSIIQIPEHIYGLCFVSLTSRSKMFSMQVVVE